jgi:hypothetical protein
MATVRDRGTVTIMSRSRLGAARSTRHSITLADLLTTIQDVMDPEDAGLVIVTVRQLLQSGRLTRRGSGGVAQCG